MTSIERAQEWLNEDWTYGDASNCHNASSEIVKDLISDLQAAQERIAKLEESKLLCTRHGYFEVAPNEPTCPACELEADLDGRFFVEQIKKATAARCAEIVAQQKGLGIGYDAMCEDIANEIKQEFGL